MARRSTTNPAISFAQKYLGTPYSYGGGTPAGPSYGIDQGASTKGYDCSALVQAAMAAEGVKVPRTTYDQYQAGTPVAANHLQPGDAVFFTGSDPKNGLPGHVGLYIGGGKYIEAPHTGGVVEVSSLAGRSDFVGGRRYTTGPAAGAAQAAVGAVGSPAAPSTPASTGSSGAAPPPSPLTERVAAVLQKYPRLDPKAVMSVASVEGMSGGIGDNGTSFGPFQIHKGGEYPGWAPQDPQAAQAWATSPQGINYAVGKIAGVARGLKGPAAISSIVTNFERPQDIPGEIRNATSRYGSTVVPTVPTAAPTVGPTPAPVAGGTTPPAGNPTPVNPQQQAAQKVSTLGRGLALELTGAAQTMLGGGTPNLTNLYRLASGYQQARTALKPPPLGGTPLARSAGGLKA